MTTFAEVSELYNQISEEIKKKYPCLRDWSFCWNARLTNTMGRAVRRASGSKYIEISTKIVKLNLNTPNFVNILKQAILHEWAHALDWENHKQWSHGPTWKAWMRTLGLPPERCFDSSIVLVKPNKAQYVIRHKVAGIYSYYRQAPHSQDLFAAGLWAIEKKLNFRDLEVINIKNA